MWKVSFSQIGWSGDLTSRLGWVASSSYELTAWPALDFLSFNAIAGMTLQLPCMLRMCANFGSESPVSPAASLCILAQSWTFLHTLSLTTLHDSHLYTRLLIAKIQANLVQNKSNKMVDKIQPYTKVILNSFHWFGSLDYVLVSFVLLVGIFHHMGWENLIFVKILYGISFFCWFALDVGPLWQKNMY